MPMLVVERKPWSDEERSAVERALHVYLLQNILPSQLNIAVLN